MSVWISDEKLLIFASLISPSKMILFEKKYQTFDTVFHHQMKHCVSCLIYYFNPGQNILGNVIKLGVRTNFAKLAHIVPLIMLVILVIQI